MPGVDDLIDQTAVTTGLDFFFILMEATQPSVVDANSE